jgi:hypothetical protein
MHTNGEYSSSAVQIIQINNEHVCAYTDGQDRGYVAYSGEIAGVTSRSQLKGDTEVLQRRPDEIQLNR